MQPAASTTVPDQRTARTRLELLDGIRAIAITLVIISHGYLLWPFDRIDAHWWVRPFFRSGNSSVTVFLVASGFLAYRSFERTGDLSDMRPAVALLRRVLRVGPALWAILVTSILVCIVDPTDPFRPVDTAYQSIRVVTYTWNWFIHDNLDISRPEFGPLWYLSVDMQAFVLMAVLVFVLRHRPKMLISALIVAIVALTWWRFHHADDFLIQVLLRTWNRMDGFVIGVLLGASLRFLPERLFRSRHLTTVCVALLVPLFYYCSFDERYVRWGSTLLALGVAAAIASITRIQTVPLVLRWMTTRPFMWMSRRTLLIYIAHEPAYHFTIRHTPGWSWRYRTVAAFVLTGVIVLALDRLVERRAAAWQASPRWHRFDRDPTPTHSTEAVR